MLSVGMVAKGAARYILAYVDLNINVINRTAAPSRDELNNNNNVMFPNPPSFQNEALTAYQDLWSNANMQGVSRWVQIMKVLKNQGELNLNTVYDWNLVRKTLQRVMPIVQVDEYYIPIVCPHNTHAEIRMVSVTEYISYYNQLPPNAFFNDIIQIVLFGFVVRPSVLEGLRLEVGIKNYVRSVLDGGIVMKYLQSQG